MIRNNLSRLTIVVLVVLWSLYQSYPPTSGDLVAQFQKNARVVPGDTTISNIVFTARELGKTAPDKAYANLQFAVGTNDLIPYFEYDAKNQPNPNGYILNRLQREVAGKIKLGLDLQGGTSFTVEMDMSKLTDTNDASGALSQAVEVIRKRVDRFGVAEPIIQPAGNNRIEIQLPGLSEDDRQRAMANIQKPAFLEFRLVHERSQELIQLNEIPPGYELLKRVERDPKGGQRLEQVVVKKKAEPGLTGSIVKRAIAMRGMTGELEINFELNAEGAERFAQVTTENTGRNLAIVLDGQLYSAPVIKVPILTGSGSISGNFDVASARELAGVLENPLKAPLRVIHSNDVDPTLGKDSIASGIKASIYGIVAVAVFMLVYYMFAGVVANVALLCNVIILIGVMCSIGTTFTLPGIAGIVLTVGMAVDANVLIYERIREELAKGKSLKGAIVAGYDRAFGTIFDSHITTLISSIILIFMGTGTVKGFGVSLTIGVAASLFTALVVTRLIFDWMLNRNLIKSLKMLHIIKTTKIDFMKYSKPAFIATWIVIALGIAWGFKRGNGVYGVEFTGGDSITLSLDQAKIVDEAKLREAITQVGVGEALIGYQKDVTTATKTLKVTLRTDDKMDENTRDVIGQKVVDKLKASFPESNFSVKEKQQVGAIIGKEIRETAIMAMIVAMFFIMVYVAFRYEFSFAIGAIFAIFHDILMTLGCYFLSGRELNSTTVAAILTIIGFSINDTVVIFDRIREDLKMGVRGSFRELVNQALNQTLSRTIITSGTVFLATMSLFIFGGGPVNDFAFTFLVGILTGTYSSIYIASAFVLWLHKGQRPNIGAGQVAVDGAASATPAKP
ncbi:MAG: protein translocase subunit SecD [Verrucomicrobiota bacterium]